MKKFFLFSFLLVALVSCQDDVKFNNPAFEAKKDGVLWRAVDSRAIIEENGSLTITGYLNKEQVILHTISTAPQTYPLGKGGGNLATYVYADAVTTLTYESEGLKDDENGEIVIEQYDAINRTITGSFKFNVKNVDDDASKFPTINYQYGKFYKVPVTQALILVK